MLRHFATIALVSGGVLALAAAPLAGGDNSWLDRVNFYRATAGLAPVQEDPTLSEAVAEPARSMVKHDEIKHTQNRRRALATPAGAEAAAASVLHSTSRARLTAVRSTAMGERDDGLGGEGDSARGHWRVRAGS